MLALFTLIVAGVCAAGIAFVHDYKQEYFWVFFYGEFGCLVTGMLLSGVEAFYWRFCSRLAKVQEMEVKHIQHASAVATLCAPIQHEAVDIRGPPRQPHLQETGGRSRYIRWAGLLLLPFSVVLLAILYVVQLIRGTLCKSDDASAFFMNPDTTPCEAVAIAPVAQLIGTTKGAQIFTQRSAVPVLYKLGNGTQTLVPMMQVRGDTGWIIDPPTEVVTIQPRYPSSSELRARASPAPRSSHASAPKDDLNDSNEDEKSVLSPPVNLLVSAPGSSVAPPADFDEADLPDRPRPQALFPGASSLERPRPQKPSSVLQSRSSAGASVISSSGSPSAIPPPTPLVRRDMRRSMTAGSIIADAAKATDASEPTGPFPLVKASSFHEQATAFRKPIGGGLFGGARPGSSVLGSSSSHVSQSYSAASAARSPPVTGAFQTLSRRSTSELKGMMAPPHVKSAGSSIGWGAPRSGANNPAATAESSGAIRAASPRRNVRSAKQPLSYISPPSAQQPRPFIPGRSASGAAASTIGGSVLGAPTAFRSSASVISPQGAWPPPPQALRR